MSPKEGLTGAKRNNEPLKSCIPIVCHANNHASIGTGRKVSSDNKHLMERRQTTRSAELRCRHVREFSIHVIWWGEADVGTSLGKKLGEKREHNAPIRKIDPEFVSRGRTRKAGGVLVRDRGSKRGRNRRINHGQPAPVPVKGHERQRRPESPWHIVYTGEHSLGERNYSKDRLAAMGSGVGGRR